MMMMAHVRLFLAQSLIPTHLTLFSKDLFLHILYCFDLSHLILFSTPSYILCIKLSYLLSFCVPASFQLDKETTSFKLCMWRIFSSLPWSTTTLYLFLLPVYIFFCFTPLVQLMIGNTMGFNHNFFELRV